MRASKPKVECRKGSVVEVGLLVVLQLQIRKVKKGSTFDIVKRTAHLRGRVSPGARPLEDMFDGAARDVATVSVEEDEYLMSFQSAPRTNVVVVANEIFEFFLPLLNIVIIVE